LAANRQRLFSFRGNMKIKQFFKIILPDVFFVLGFACVFYGVYLIYVPAALITAGVFISYMALPLKRK